MSNVKHYKAPRRRTLFQMSDEQIRECIKAQRKQEQELAKAASAGLFLTAADLRDE